MVVSQNLLIALCLSYQLQACVAFTSINEEPVTKISASVRQPLPEKHRNAEDLAQLLKGVDSVYLGPTITIGFLSVYGSNAFPVVAGQQRSTTKFHPVVAAGRPGSGKMIGFAHSGIIDAGDANHGDITGRKKLLLNSLEWARSSWSGSGSLHVGFYGNSGLPEDLISLVKFYNMSATRVNPDDVDDYFKLTEFDVIVSKHYPNEKQALILKDYVEHGGGLLHGQTGWSSPIEGHFGANYPANMAASHAGFVWRNTQAYAAPESDAGISTAQNKLQDTHVQDAWNKIKGLLNKDFNDTPEDLWDVVANGLQFIPPKDKFWEDSNFYAEAMSILLRKSLFG